MRPSCDLHATLKPRNTATLQRYPSHSQDVTPCFKPFSLGVHFHASAGANEVPVAKDVVNAAHGGPEFMVVEPLGREAGLLAGVGAAPRLRGQHIGGVWRVLQNIILLVCLAALNAVALSVSPHERPAELSPPL